MSFLFRLLSVEFCKIKINTMYVNIAFLFAPCGTFLCGKYGLMASGSSKWHLDLLNNLQQYDKTISYLKPSNAPFYFGVKSDGLDYGFVYI